MIFLRPLIELVIVVLFVLLFDRLVHAYECLATSQAVLDGGATHASYITKNGQRCWHAGKPKEPIFKPLTVRTTQVPLPRPRQPTVADRLFTEFLFWLQNGGLYGEGE